MASFDASLYPISTPSTMLSVIRSKVLMLSGSSFFALQTRANSCSPLLALIVFTA